MSFVQAGMVFTLAGTMSLNKVQNSYQVVQLYGLSVHCQCGNYGILSAEAPLPGWLVPVKASKVKEETTLETKCVPVCCKYDKERHAFEMMRGKTSADGASGEIMLSIFQVVPKQAFLGKTAVILVRSPHEDIISLGTSSGQKKKQATKQQLSIGGSGLMASVNAGSATSSNKTGNKGVVVDAVKHLLR